MNRTWRGPIAGDGFRDTSVVEIYYNNNQPWGIDAEFGYDVETVSLHEAGHGLSLPHFGQAFRTLKNGKLHYAPRCVMNASYTGLLQEPTGRDIGFFESIWATWPLE